VPGTKSFVDIGILGQGQDAACRLNPPFLDDHPAIMQGGNRHKNRDEQLLAQSGIKIRAGFYKITHLDR